MKLLLLLLALGISEISAQVSSSALLGEVRDPSNAVIPTVQITVRNDATGFSRSVLTGPQGGYRIGELIPGTYTLTTEKHGFRQLTAGGILLEVNQTARFDVRLEVGAAHDSVNVEAEVSPVQTEDPSVGYRLDHRTTTALPLAARNVIALITLGPGAVPRQLSGFTHDVVNDVQEGSRGSVALNTPINGSRSTMNAFIMDGAYDTDRNTFAIAVIPPLDSIQEFRIASSLPSAEFAQAGGGIIDLVSRSGAQALHGGAFEFFRNEALDAHNFFDDPALPRPIFRQNQFGAAIGGPVPLPSTFFFATYEGLRGKSATASLALVPGQTLRSGDFTGRNTIYDPLNIDPVTGARQPFPGNVIPPERIDPIARKFLDLYEPLPNRANAGSNYLDATPNQNTNNSVSGRIDHQFRDHSWLFGRYTLNNDDGRIVTTFPELPTSERLRAQQFALGHTSGGVRLLNEARVAFTRFRLFDIPESALNNNNVAANLGISGLPANPLNFGLPFFLVTNFSTVTDSPTVPQIQRDNLWSLSDGVSLVRGRHTWKFGIEWLHSQLNYLQSQDARGRYTFTGAFTSNPSLPGNPGDAFADFLLGFPQDTSRHVGSTQAYLRQNSYAGYAQHDWMVSSALTLNFGLRYEYVSPYTEARNRLLNLDYSTLPADPRLVQVHSAVEPDRNNFAPRAGLALRLPRAIFGARETVFRAGYGIYYSPEIAVEAYDLILNGIRNEINETSGSSAPFLTTRNGFPQTAGSGFPSYFGLDPAARTPYVQQWNASIQREIARGTVLELAYVGSKGTKLGRFRRFNTPQQVETGANLPPRPGDLQTLRTFPDLGAIYQRQHIANSSYQSLQFKADKRFSGGLGLLASFVWSKSIDDADSVIPGLFDSFGAQDERNLRLERGLSFFNVGRRVSAGFVYDFPNRRFVRPLLNNWELSGIVTLQDGMPLNPVYFAFDPANSGTPNRPDVVPGQSVTLPRSQRTIEHFFNAAAFQTPQPYHFGNAGRNILPGPGINIFDLAMHRRFPVRETAGFELRAEFFNAFNHPNWGIPGEYPDFAPFFGRILTTGQPRRIQMGLRFDF
jgi:hypothetical protein